MRHNQGTISLNLKVERMTSHSILFALILNLGLFVGGPLHSADDACSLALKEFDLRNSEKLKAGSSSTDDALKQKTKIIGRVKEIKTGLSDLSAGKVVVIAGIEGSGKSSVIQGIKDEIKEGRAPKFPKETEFLEISARSLMFANPEQGGQGMKFPVDALRENLKKRASGKKIVVVVRDADQVLEKVTGSGSSEIAPQKGAVAQLIRDLASMDNVSLVLEGRDAKYIVEDRDIQRRINQPIQINPLKREVQLQAIDNYIKHDQAEIPVVLPESPHRLGLLKLGRWINQASPLDGAKNLIDAARERMALAEYSTPEGILELEEKISQLESEIPLLQAAAATNPQAKIDLVNKAKEKKALGDKKTALSTQFQSEKTKVKEIRAKTKEIGSLEKDLQGLQSSASFDSTKIAAKKTEISNAKTALATLEADLKTVQGNQPLLEAIIDIHSLKRIAGEMKPGVELDLDGSSFTRRLLDLAKNLKKKVVGQTQAEIIDDMVARIIPTMKVDVDGVEMSARGSDAPHRGANFLLLGPPGSGKTSIARHLAKLLFGTEEDLLEIPMNELTAAFAESQLTGTKPGYVGDTMGTLPRAFVKGENLVVIFDEVEKAHSDMTKVLYRVLEQGKVNDGTGKTYHVKNLINVFTSNASEALIQGKLKAKREYVLKMKGKLSPEFERKSLRLTAEDIAEINDSLKDVRSPDGGHTFPTAFISRLQATYVFEPVNDLRELTKNKIDQELKQRENLKTLGLQIEIDDSLVETISEKGTSDVLGVRTLPNMFTKLLMDPVVRHTIDTNLPADQRIAKGDRIEFKVTEQTTERVIQREGKDPIVEKRTKKMLTMIVTNGLVIDTTKPDETRASAAQAGREKFRVDLIAIDDIPYEDPRKYLEIQNAKKAQEGASSLADKNKNKPGAKPDAAKPSGESTAPATSGDQPPMDPAQLEMMMQQLEASRGQGESEAGDAGEASENGDGATGDGEISDAGEDDGSVPLSARPKAGSSGEQSTADGKPATSTPAKPKVSPEQRRAAHAAMVAFRQKLATLGLGDDESLAEVFSGVADGTESPEDALADEAAASEDPDLAEAEASGDAAVGDTSASSVPASAEPAPQPLPQPNPARP